MLRTRRLTLVSMRHEVMEAILAADWSKASRLLGAAFPEEWHRETWDWLRGYANRAERDPSSLAWGPHLLFLDGARGDGKEIVGEAGFHGPPSAEGTVEFGYMVVTKHRRQGFAEEAVQALLSWAGRQQGVAEFVAAVHPSNTASSNLLRKLGFTEVGRYRHAERGEQLIFRRRSRQTS